MAKSDTPTLAEVPQVNGVALTTGGTKGTSKAQTVTLLPLKALNVIPGHNPRTKFPKEAHEELVASIKKHGVTSALLVRQADKAGYFEIVAGERRYRAAKAAGLESVPVIVRTDLSDPLEAKAVAMAENSEDARAALNSMDLADACQGFAKAGWSVAKIASECGYSQATIRRALKLAEAPEGIQKSVRAGDMAVGAATALASLPEATRAQVQKKLAAEHATEDRVKLLAKEIGKADVAGKVAPASGKRGRPAKAAAAVVVWRGNKASGEVLESLALELVRMDADEDLKGSIAYCQVQGAVAALLYLRTDLDSATLPVDAEDATDADRKVLAQFDTLYRQVAAKAAKAAKTAAVAE